MQTTSLTDVLIVGAGPVGLTLAIDLARRGIACRIIDQNQTYPIGTRARGVSARTLEVFDDLGVLERLLPYVEPMLPWRSYDSNGQLVREMTPTAMFNPANQPGTPDRPYPGNVLIGQQHTESVLRERLSSFGLRVEQDTRLTGLTQDADQVVARVIRRGREEEIRAGYLVGCDGGNSTVRKCVAIPFLGETWEERYTMFGNLDVHGLDPSYWYSWSDPDGGLVTLNPMPRSNTWFFTAPLLPDEQGALPPTTVETFQRIFDERVGIPGVRFGSPIYLSIYRLNIRLVEHYRSGRVFLAGDAAHVHPPAGGQGMNTGIQDAYNLGWKLAHVLSGAPEALLDTYEAERLPIARQVLATSTARLLSWARPDTGGTSSGVQNMSAMLEGKDPFSDVTQLSIHYRESPLACNLDEATGIRAGDRAPDAPCTRASRSEPVRLFECFRGTHLTLLIFGAQPAPRLPVTYQRSLRVYTLTRSAGAAADTDHVLLDRDGYAHRTYGVTENALILIRPDGYVGLTGENPDQEAILSYLREIIG